MYRSSSFCPGNNGRLLFQEFMQDIEEDPKYREKINIYRRERISKPSTTTEDDDKADNDFPALEEILDDLDIKDVEMQETT
jgi:hypothetical protein